MSSLNPKIGTPGFDKPYLHGVFEIQKANRNAKIVTESTTIQQTFETSPRLTQLLMR